MKKTNPVLLRNDVSSNFRILNCKIEIKIQSDLKNAIYKYSYTIEKMNNCSNIWREVFAYAKNDVKIGEVKDENRVGLENHLKSLDTTNSKKNTELTIKFAKNLKVGSSYSFWYECKTKIESVKNINFLGGNGSVWFWCAHEFSIDEFEVIKTVPKSIKIIATNPITPINNENKSVSFKKSNLLPNEFATSAIVYEKRVLGIKPSIANKAEKIFYFLLGLGATKLIEQLFF